MRVATYTRISTDEEHQPYSLDAQATRLASYIASQEGWELTRQFTDSMTGATTVIPRQRNWTSVPHASVRLATPTM